ncbi:unnamed protein product [Diatraea saccharalis]|uniref:Uncharacterized protein n=1 Tax=Diatraea saccharalis TaxID=40085 RepID=A0A9N9WCR3_9NEOP|nr:unnamed protein product [Diatraea saccharalis]
MSSPPRARQEESKFQITLQELKATKELVEQLLREREDNEKELLDVLEKNKLCKKELSELHCNYLIITEEKDRLQLVIEGFDQCRSEYEKALRLISGLEQQLQEANDCIYKLESEQTKVMASQNQSLYDELQGCTLVSAVGSDLSLPGIIKVMLEIGGGIPLRRNYVAEGGRDVDSWFARAVSIHSMSVRWRHYANAKFL